MYFYFYIAVENFSLFVKKSLLSIKRFCFSKNNMKVTLKINLGKKQQGFYAAAVVNLYYAFITLFLLELLRSCLLLPRRQ